MSAIKVMIVEDEPLIAEDLAIALTHIDCRVCAISYTKTEAVEALRTNLPDIVLLDINLSGGTEGIEIGHLINDKFQIPFIFLTSYSDKKTIELAKATEPSGYIVKPFTEASLYVSLEIALHNFAQKNKHRFPELNLSLINTQLPSVLSVREFEVLQMIYNGKANHQIAALLFVSINTIKRHINNAYLKLDVSSRTLALSRLRELMLRA